MSKENINKMEGAVGGENITNADMRDTHQNDDRHVPASNNDSQANLPNGTNTMEMMQRMMTCQQEMMQTMNVLMQQMILTKTPKILPPGKFRLREGQSLLQFLSHYENYCEKRYPGSSEGMLPLLGSYLEEPVLTVYKTIVKNTNDFVDAKEQLLEWNRKFLEKEEKNETKYFMDATMGVEETVGIYAIRLEGLAQKAFPGNNVREMDIVIRKLMDSLPTAERAQVRASADTMAVMLGEKLPWERIVSLAEMLCPRTGSEVTSTNRGERDFPEVVDLTRNSPLVGNFGQTTTNKETGSDSRTYYRTSLPQSSTENLPTFEASPTRESSRQYGTGATPRRQANTFQYPRRPNTRVNESNTTGNSLVCHFCKKTGHFMKNCRWRPLCQYCGLRGHVFNDCYAKKNKCLACQEEGHTVKECRRDKKEQTKCPYCSASHWGKDCTQKPTEN